MADTGGNNNSNNNGSRPNNKKTPGNNFYRMKNRFQNFRNSGPRERPVSLLIPQPSSNNQSNASSSSSSNNSSGTNTSTAIGRSSETTSFRISKKSGPYSGWQLYFPETGESFNSNNHQHQLINCKNFIYLFRIQR